MKQTAVEWLVKELESYGNTQFCKIEWEQLDLLIEQAKEMEKEQIIEFADEYGTYLLQGGTMSAVTYKETFIVP